ncbi:MAG: DUF1097 domain-containing protein [Coprococcus sp.]
MSHKTVICFAIWTSFWSALFNHFYTVYFGSFGVPWIMFVCMAIFFGMNGTPKQVPGMILSAFCGLAWEQFDFILINFFGGTCHMSLRWQALWPSAVQPSPCTFISNCLVQHRLALCRLSLPVSA